MRIALYCLDMTGHLNPMTTLGGELAQRGHTVTVVGLPPAERFAERAGLAYVRIGTHDYHSHIAPGRAQLAELSGLAALKLTGQLLGDIEVIALRDLPGAFQSANIEAVITDQVSVAGACVAEATKLPFVLACNALSLLQESRVPPPVLSWRYRTAPVARLRNQFGNLVLHWAASPIRRAIAEYRTMHCLAPVRNANTTGTLGLAQVAQQPAFFDFPRKNLPDHFHYTGPWHEASRDRADSFPWDKLDGRPMIYASLGTLQNRLKNLFAAIVTACATLPVQLVLALGSRDAIWDGPTASNVLVVPFAPQLQLLERATAVITHAGLNTALESLARGLPMVCLPITNDQPGVAERVRWLGAGEVIATSRATPQRLRSALQAILNEPNYRTAAVVCQKQLEQSPGVRGAADIVEQALTTGQRVTQANRKFTSHSRA